MRIVQSNIDPAEIVKFLKSRGTGILLKFPSHEYTVYRILLDTNDVHKLVLWWEHRKHTDGKSTKVTDAAITSYESDRIKRIIEGDAVKGLTPIDIRKDPNFELVLESNSVESDFWNIIDGNHRTIAHQITIENFLVPGQVSELGLNG